MSPPGLAAEQHAITEIFVKVAAAIVAPDTTPAGRAALMAFQGRTLEFVDVERLRAGLPADRWEFSGHPNGWSPAAVADVVEEARRIILAVGQGLRMAGREERARLLALQTTACLG